MLVLSSARVRASLLASTALLALPAVAQAQDAGIERPDSVGPEAYGSAVTISAVKAEPQQVPIESFAPTIEPEIVIANPNTATTARDANNITGIGQMIVDEKNGFIGLCTGTLINPRTVIFAAHCVNERAANAYGAASGGQPIGFGFGSNNNVAGASAFGGWLGNYLTNISRAMYNVNYVAYNAASLEPDAAGFLYADVAVASLDTPAANVPTWALLFSALPGKPITAASGAGYHVQLAGYGNNGTGTSGSTGGIDFRRRLAENFVGGLASLDQFENFLFGGNSITNPQNLYWIDFDDPRRGTASPPSAFDFNAWRDNAVPANASGNSQEGITASGDSGGPLILDQAFATKFILGVLSGGYTRFFNGQPANGYGTASFYQPLYLYWDYVAANNPYHYVSTVAGDADWTSASHWVTTLDPNYFILDANGNPINGLPTNPGQGKTGNTGTWGQACFQSGGVSDCLDMTTGVETIEAKPIGTAATDGMAVVSADTLAATADDDSVGTVTAQQSLERVPASSQAITQQALPAATLANGLPGATNFVPNNFNGDRLTSTAPRYFDVNLAAAGTTTLGSTVTIDRFKITNANATLSIGAAGSLTSLIDVTHVTGVINVNGTLTSVGDYSFVSGLLSGTGRVNAPFLTSVIGNFAPGTVGTIGTLTIGGNLVMASGSTYAVDIGPAGTSDKLAVVANGTSTGAANLGGRVLVNPVTGYTVRAGDTFTILTAAGGRTGTFTTSALSAILTPTLSYTANNVNMTMIAGKYADVITTSPTQISFAALMDRNRANPPLQALYDFLDLQSAGTIQGTFESWAPRTETLVQSLGIVLTENMDKFYSSRLASLDTDETLDGSLTVIGAPLETVAMRTGANLLTGAQGIADGTDTQVVANQFPTGMRGYLAGGYLSGEADSMSTAVPFGGDDDFDGFYVATGIEAQDSGHSMFGFGASYTSVDGTTGGAPQQVDGQQLELAAYGKSQYGNIVLDARADVGLLIVDTDRAVTLGAGNYRLKSRDKALNYAGEVGVSTMFGDEIQVGPRVAIRAGKIEFGPTTEYGGPMALLYDRQDYTSFQGMAGVVLGGQAKNVHPFASAYWVHEFEDQETSVGANFVNGVGFNALFGLNGQDNDWAEASAGLSFDAAGLEFSVSADTTLFRSDVSNQTYRGSMTFKF